MYKCFHIWVSVPTVRYNLYGKIWPKFDSVVSSVISPHDLVIRELLLRKNSSSYIFKSFSPLSYFRFHRAASYIKHFIVCHYYLTRLKVFAPHARIIISQFYFLYTINPVNPYLLVHLIFCTVSTDSRTQNPIVARLTHIKHRNPRFEREIQE